MQSFIQKSEHNTYLDIGPVDTEVDVPVHIMIVMVNFYYRFMWSVVKSIPLKIKLLQKGPNSVVHEHVPVGSLHLMGCREDVHEFMYNNALQQKSKKGNMSMCPWAMCHSLIPSHHLTKRPWMICPVARGGERYARICWVLTAEAEGQAYLILIYIFTVPAYKVCWNVFSLQIETLNESFTTKSYAVQKLMLRHFYYYRQSC